MSITLIPGEFSQFTIAIAIISGFIVFFGYVSMFLKERLFLSEAFVALIVGIIAGPLVTNGINPYGWEDNDEITKQLSRCIIAIQVMAVGIELPKHYIKREWVTMAMFLLPVMLFMWLVSGLFIWALVPPINYLESLVVAACVCPTDPILANSVVKGRFAEKHVPTHIRNALSAESGANDGMGFPFLFLAIFLLGEDHVGKAIGKWIYETCLFQIALSCVIGVVVGWIARKILQFSERRHLIDKPSFLSFAIALSLFLMSMTGFSGSDDVLACFVAGNAFSWDDWFRKETEEAHFQDVIDMMLNLAIFVYIGAIIPWWSFNDASLGLTPWRLVVIAVLILLFRRLPIVLLLKPAMPAIKTYREAAFSGWFGPIGVGAVFLSKIAKEEMGQVYPYQKGDEEPIPIRVISPLVLFIVLSSVLVHGTTVPVFKLGKRIRTRTLSLASIASNNTRFRWSIFSRRGRDSPESSLTQTERNTLYNTSHHPKDTTHISGMAPSATDDYAVDMLSDSLSDTETTDEEFIPQDTLDGSQTVVPEDLEHGIPGHRNFSVATLESQSIRFAEPIKPRNANMSEEKKQGAPPLPESRPQRRTMLRRIMQWLPWTTSEGKQSNISHSAKQMENAYKKQPDCEKHIPETLFHDPSHLVANVWDERENVVVEDPNGIVSPQVIDKTQPDWKQQMTNAIQKVNHTMNQPEKENTNQEASPSASLSPSSTSSDHL